MELAGVTDHFPVKAAALHAKAMSSFCSFLSSTEHVALLALQISSALENSTNGAVELLLSSSSWSKVHLLP